MRPILSSIGTQQTHNNPLNDSHDQTLTTHLDENITYTTTDFPYHPRRPTTAFSTWLNSSFSRMASALVTFPSTFLPVVIS